MSGPFCWWLVSLLLSEAGGRKFGSPVRNSCAGASVGAKIECSANAPLYWPASRSYRYFPESYQLATAAAGLQIQPFPYTYSQQWHEAAVA